MARKKGALRTGQRNNKVKKNGSTIVRKEGHSCHRGKRCVGVFLQTLTLLHIYAAEIFGQL